MAEEGGGAVEVLVERAPARVLPVPASPRSPRPRPLSSLTYVASTMNVLFIYVLVCALLVSLATSSPIHGIWAHLPHVAEAQSKRNYYGALRHAYLIDEPLDKRSAFSGVLIGPYGYGMYGKNEPVQFRSLEEQ